MVGGRGIVKGMADLPEFNVSPETVVEVVLNLRRNYLNLVVGTQYWFLQ